MHPQSVIATRLMLVTVLGCGDHDSESQGCADAFYADTDADGYGDVSHATTACSMPSGYAATADDCDDTNPEVHPDAAEVCDGLDNDCNDSVDTDAIDAATWYADTDADGFGDDLAVDQQCTQPSGSVAVGGDCDDTDPAVNPNADEICDEIDDDCDELVDALDPTLVDGTSWYADVDQDGFGDPTSGAYLCVQPDGSIDNDADCDDADAAIHPDATEACDDIDNDCDGFTDDEDLDAPVAGASTFFADSDGDGLGDAGVVITACVQPKDCVDNEDDCDDSTVKIGVALDYYNDVDRDGYGAGATHATCTPDPNDVLVDGDCRPTYGDIYPAAPEVCDRRDNNCDGLTDEDDPLITDAVTFARDADGDGYGDDAATVVSCSAVSGYVATGGDCDDGDASAFPGGLEYCDSIDNDCNSSVDDDVDYVDWYADSDGDGFGNDGDVKNDCIQPSGYASLAGDCDDSESGTNPDAAEVCDDGVDNDCDGRACTTYDLSLADAELTGAGALSDAGDVDGDGNDDLLLGNYGDDDGGVNAGAVYLLRGPPIGEVDLASDAQAKLVGEAAGDNAGWDVAGAGDIDGDAHHDLLVGAPVAEAWAGAAYLVAGPVTGTIDLSSADAKLVGSGFAGGHVAGVGDVDGDTRDDVLVGAYLDGEGGVHAGAAYLVLGGVTGTVDMATMAQAKLVGEEAYDAVGIGVGKLGKFPVAAAGDVDGDGTPDLLVGAYGNDEGSGDGGAAYVVLGPVTGTLDLSLADAKLMGEVDSFEAGASVSGNGDVDGDGYDDVLVGGAWSFDFSGGGLGNGTAYLVLGPVSGKRDLSTADAIFHGEASGDYAGWSVAVDGDVDADGHSDVLIGSLASKAYLVHGPVEGAFGLEHADVLFDGGGWRVAGGGDFDGDESDDVAIDAYVIYGSGL